jgi:hypothetical protein
MQAVPSADAFDRAFSLALFIHQDRAVALRIATDALDALPLECAKQRKREDYRSGSLKRGIIKVSVSALQVLQRLVLIESERIEVEQERSAPSSVMDRDKIIRFIAYLSRKSMMRSSVYVAFGFGRILHNYSMREAGSIFETMTNEFKQDDSYRDVKGRLMNELRSRFPGQLGIELGAENEDRFSSIPNPQRYHRLVDECLAQFTPWETPCVLPPNATIQYVALRFKGPPSSEPGYSAIELERFHAIVHLACFHYLTAALGLDPPLDRLTLPVFSETSH